MSSSDNAVPQWKKDLIARLRSQNRRTATAAGRQQLFDPHQRTSVSVPAGSSVQQPSRSEPVAVGVPERCESACATMVQDRSRDSDSGSSAEDLHYGPGIVSKLKERYLSLAKREAPRPVAPLRKAASLEDLLDDAPAAPRRFQRSDNHANNRYRSAKRGSELKRARSVETISDERDVKGAKRESFHEEMLISEGNDAFDKKPPEKTYTQRVNRPKRIAPVMNEKEKPPADVVKQAKMIFERRPEQRTRPPQQTGEVAAKVATYKNIIVQAKAKKPAVKAKPQLCEKPKTNGVKIKAKPEKEAPSLPSPIPDISRIDFKTEDAVNSTSLSETPDLIITSSPLPAVNSPSFRISATENFIKEEIRLALIERTPPSPALEDPKPAFNFTPKNKNVLDTQTPPSQPLKLEINGVSNGETNNERGKVQVLNLTTLEIEKNLINTAKTLEKPAKGGVGVKVVVEEVTVKKVPKVVKQPRREPENNTIVFNFTTRKDVPDHVQNDGVTRVAKPEKPKVGEGGIILLPGASIGESFTDEDEELLRSLEGPPSPCDVTFINDNILIDGKSSLSQKTKKAKMKISFVDEGPEIYEYPSESSLLIEDSPKSPPTAQIRNSVPSLTGTSSLANYTPKSTEEFQPGVTRSVQSMPTKAENPETSELILQEVEKPILFSAGANSDILF